MPKIPKALLQLPPASIAALEKLGADLAVARLRRKASLKTMEYLYYAGCVGGRCA